MNAGGFCDVDNLFSKGSLSLGHISVLEMVVKQGNRFSRLAILQGLFFGSNTSSAIVQPKGLSRLGINRDSHPLLTKVHAAGITRHGIDG